MEALQRTVQVGNQTVSAYVSRSAGPTAVLVHGLGLSSASFSKQLLGALGTQLQLVAIDLPGHGASSAPADASGYSLSNLSTVFLQALQALEVDEAVFVGHDLGAHVILASVPRLPKARGVVLFGAVPADADDAQLPAKVFSHPRQICDLLEQSPIDRAQALELGAYFLGTNQLDKPIVDSILASDPVARQTLLNDVRKRTWTHGAASLQHLHSKGIPYSVLHGGRGQTARLDMLGQLSLPGLWRRAIQVVPGSGEHVAFSHPEDFGHILRELVEAVFGDIKQYVARRESQQMQRWQVHQPGSPGQQNGSPRKIFTRSEPGTMPHVASRYELPVETSPVRRPSQDSPPKVANPYARGRVSGGQMPHPSMRFEPPVDPPAPQSPASPGQDGSPTKNPNARGRVAPGTMPHPGSRFEHVPETDVAQRRTSQPVLMNRNSRGRMEPGTMPHPGSRFELHTDSPQREQRQRPSIPNARGRMEPGTMPHPAARFEIDPTTSPRPHHSDQTAQVDKSYSGVRVNKPPGGEDAITFG